MISKIIKIYLKIFNIKFGENCVFYGVPIIYKHKTAKINIKDNLTVRSSFLSNMLGLYQRTIIMAREGAEINIGNNVGVSGVTIYARKSITIGSYTNIGGNTKILDNDFHPINPEERKKDNKEKIKSKEIIIGENVFIGCNSIILKGTTIGNNSVVGAGSVVVGKFPDNVIIAGNPAKILKKIEV